MPTPETFTDLNIINQALTGVMGQDPIADLISDESTAAQIMRQNYVAVSESAQTKTAWHFNTTKVALNKLSGEPINRWAAAWQLPTDNLKILTTWPPSNYEVHGTKLLTNDTDQVHLDYTRKLEEAFWPSWFQRYVVARLVMRTVKGITGAKATQDMKDELDDARSDALFQDAQQQPNQTVLPSAFVDVRH